MVSWKIDESKLLDGYYGAILNGGSLCKDGDRVWSKYDEQ
jgi:hypothetical protein